MLHLLLILLFFIIFLSSSKTCITFITELILLCWKLQRIIIKSKKNCSDIITVTEDLQQKDPLTKDQQEANEQKNYGDEVSWNC